MAIWSFVAAVFTAFERERLEMAWFLNQYYCGDCGTDWEDEWSCCCDDECPACGSGDWSPVVSQDLTETSEDTGDTLILYRSPDDADDSPKYREVARFPYRELR